MSRRTRPRAHPRASRTPAHAIPARAPGRHELGQSFLVDRRAIADVVALVDATRGPILEIGPGDGALTLPIARLGRPLRGLEADGRRAARLDARTPPTVRIEHADALAHRFDARPHVVVSNLPFHITTALLRRLLAAPGWTDAVLIAQWEVARRRAGVGGGSQLTAQAAPWFAFELGRRIPRSAFRPMPQVDAGLFAVRRRERPLVEASDRRAYEALVARCFSAPGAGLARILPAAGALPAQAAKRWLRERGHPPHALPRDLSPDDWAALWHRHREVR